MAYLMPGLRKGTVLVYNGYRYHKNRSTKVKIYWRCWRKTCKGTLTTSFFDMTVERPDIRVLSVEDHSHPEDDDRINADEVFNQAKEIVKLDPTKPIKRVYDDVIGAFVDNEEYEELPDFSRVRSKLQRVRASLIPAIPHDIEDVLIENEWTENWAGEPFLSHIDNDWGISVFATRENYRTLSRCSTIYIDGTFKTCPEPYSQFVTIHGKRLGRVFTFVMCLLTGKTIGQYRQLLQHVKGKVRQITGRRWHPTKVVCDFEVSLISALETELPHTTICGCYFHFCQSLWRKIQDLGLARSYRQSRRVQRLLRKIMALGHLPIALLRQNFRRLVGANSTRRVINRYAAVQDFLLFVENNYLNGRFPMRLWNVYGREKDCRTNNIVEGFHYRWNTSVQRKHPSLWLFIRKMKDEERLERRNLRARVQGAAEVPVKRKWRRLEQRIKRLRRQYQNGDRNLEEYWNAMSYVVKQYQ